MDAITQFFQDNGHDLLVKTWEHLYISLSAVILGIVVAVPVGILLTRSPKIANFVIGIVSVLQTVPSLAILAFIIPILGVGKIPAIVALFIYSVLPIMRNTFIGVRGVDKNLIESGRGMGMTSWQLVKNVELPNSISVIMAGIRLSAVYIIAWATLASYIGAGGLGDFIFNGLNLYRPDLILGGAIPVTILALLVEFFLGKLEVRITPKAIRAAKENM
ncbi:choline ABC transporter permease [Listeria newyorkensis]|uniref:ABC transporter permease n=3 Tax=Listeria TaxID=1637 RepID=A0A841YTS5_9LIST|nr:MULTISPECIES: ABC transporter permease [Listeria]KGL45278.1 choline ABC transporter permease [Listeriaceae bacterium FSL A5-0209]AQY51143.1 choline ABC transporter permease [Listeria weihenstephanensis]EUJ36928.1 glycine/betaine/L-proline ABC transporter permease [Listeria weihenstephanensis FSL R9-0317]KGL40172.1 choline ABC transporter permease [Listeria newyorkensis]KMT63420.1 glycine/betaine/L-proline ABC transporter permease [Listeria newyorkensis]